MDFEQIRKALASSDNTSGQAVHMEDLDRVLHEYLFTLTPLVALTRREQAFGPTHEFTRRTAIPSAWVQGELADPDFTQTTYERRSVQLKILRIYGGVSGFQQRMSERFINALQDEIFAATQGYNKVLEWMIAYGNTSDTYQFGGIEQHILSDTTAKKALSAGGNIYQPNADILLSHLDTAIDAVSYNNNTLSDAYGFLMSPQLISRVSGLQTKISRDVPMMEFEGGFRMATYRGFPLIPTKMFRPATTTTSPAVTATKGAGGSLADDEYFYRISSVTEDGEQFVGDEDSATTETTNNKVVLTWAADANAKLYKIWRGLATGVANMTLLDTIAAKSYTSGKVSGNVATYTDDGTKTPNSAVLPLTGASKHQETAMLVNLSQAHGFSLIGARSPLGDPLETFVTYTPLATLNSAYRFMIEGFMALKVPYPEQHVILRGVSAA